MKTRYPEIDIVRVTGHVVGTHDRKGSRRKPWKCDVWRYVDTETGAHVGPQMKTKAEALANLGAYAKEFGL